MSAVGLIRVGDDRGSMDSSPYGFDVSARPFGYLLDCLDFRSTSNTPLLEQVGLSFPHATPIMRLSMLFQPVSIYPVKSYACEAVHRLLRWAVNVNIRYGMNATIVDIEILI